MSGCWRRTNTPVLFLDGAYSLKIEVMDLFGNSGVESDKTRFLIILCLAIIAVIAYSVASSADEPVVDIGPLDVYETTTHNFNVTVGNYNGNYEITSLRLVSNNLEILSMADYLGWSENYTSDFAHWYDGSIATNVLLALFQLNARASQVDANTSEIIEITLTDPEGNDHEYDIPFTIINDDSAPELSNNIPQDGDHIMEGITDQLVTIDAVDPETGVESVTFGWTLCEQDNSSNVTPSSYGVELDQFEDSASYSDIIDLSEYENEEEVCFVFEAENNGGETVDLEGVFTLDGEAPSVVLDAPEDEALINAESEFMFTATDNLAETLDCQFYNDAIVVQNVTADNGVQQIVAAVDAEEGVHDWKVVCVDRAGWETESEERMYILDKTAPEIMLLNLENNAVISFMTLIQFNVTDNYQLQQVYYELDGTRYDVSNQFSIDPFDWAEGPTTITVVAEDTAGNINAEDYVFIVDRTAPTVDLTSPENESDVHVTFEFEIDDNYDPTLLCDLVVDNESRQSDVFNTNETGMFVDLLDIGNHTWYVSCTDDADNTGFSGIDTVTIIDTSGPDITFNHATTYFRGDTMYFNVTIIDPSNVEDVDATLEMPNTDVMEVFLLERDGEYVQDYSTDSNSSLGTYILDVYAVDELGNPSRDQSEILLTYRYVIEIGLSDNSIELGETVMVEGTVRFDNGSAVPEETVTVRLPSGDVEAPIGEDGTFTYSYTPNETGSYEIIAEITPDNGVMFSDSVLLDVLEPKVQDDDSGNGGGVNYNRDRDTTHSSGSCSPDWDCDSWSECENSNKYRICTQSNCGDHEATKTYRRACHVPEEIEPEETTEEPEPDNGDSGNGFFVNDTEQTNEEPVIDEDEGNGGLFGRIGRAFGFLTGAGTGFSLFIIVLIALGLVALLFMTGWAPSTKKQTKGDELFGNYFEKRR